jgi:prevent-host-death family protein
MHVWQMQEAKARLSELVKLAESEGPQDITVHGKSVAVVVSRATSSACRAADNRSSISCASRRCTVSKSLSSSETAASRGRWSLELAGR